MQTTCVLDFDNTLLGTDSMRHIIVAEKLYYNPLVFIWGVLVFFAMIFLPKARQVFVRSRFKFHVLRLLVQRGEQSIIKKYAEYFSTKINLPLAKFFAEKYPHIVVVTASWQPLVEAVLKQSGMPFSVLGTVFNGDKRAFITNWNVAKLNALAGVGINAFDLVTDSTDDRPLMLKAGKTYLIKPNQAPPYV